MNDVNSDKTPAGITPAGIEAFAAAYTAAWNSHEPARVADFYAEDGVLIINAGEPSRGRAGVTEAAAGFMSAFPDLQLACDGVELADDRIHYHWTLKGTNTGPEGTGNNVVISGYESWVFDGDGLVKESLGTFDAEEYNRQLQEGAGDT